MLRTIFFFVTFIPWTLFVIFTGVPLSFLSPDYLHNYARFWAQVGLRLAGVRLSAEGQQHLQQGQPVIYMPNHQSNFDILALFASLPGQFRWLAKEELFRIPLFGFAMRRSGYIPIDRSDRKKSMLSMKEAARRISEGASVIVFPEGTRSMDGKLLPFKKGGFMLALQAGVPVVPVAITGSRDINPKHSRWIQGGHIQVRIFPPVAAGQQAAADRDAFMEAVRHPIATAVGE
ncbi:1-acyl-sn-glycerol-3-phosphate acyltransferase [Desulfuromonas versatilis]|uniref:1-acyl-sn-glycerol-3-phosphate acyltransferase n=1 Tax=Desulfuromonas versatilis TaxID=2802975 RepID=A0ABN6E1D1_9BACT|nr:lysophospholipid acyltransferase family protein [Desulfuromonas versatilis]BCR06136.1 1-acyl-sn-glycerol-3-phosphate acyltransferase [Desulfuromonas versatilis]